MGGSRGHWDIDIGEHAKAKRDLAARARRLAKGLLLKADRARLERHAEELERQATELERQAATANVPVTPSRTVVHVQQQEQQQQGSVVKATDLKDEKPKH